MPQHPLGVEYVPRPVVGHRRAEVPQVVQPDGPERGVRQLRGDGVPQPDPAPRHLPPLREGLVVYPEAVLPEVRPQQGQRLPPDLHVPCCAAFRRSDCDDASL